MARVLITGDRNWATFNIATAVLSRLERRYGRRLTIVVGDAPGVDAAFLEMARAMRIDVDGPHEARWGDLDAPGAVVRRRKDGTKYNAQAGPDRNARMVATRPAFCVAVHANLGYSRGTSDCVRRCLAAGIPCYWIKDNDVRPVEVLGFDGREVIVKTKEPACAPSAAS